MPDLTALHTTHMGHQGLSFLVCENFYTISKIQQE